MSVKSRREEKEKVAIHSATLDPEHHDEPSGVESMKSRYGYNRKQLNENLNPLRKFFASRVGKHWNKVYSEVREHLDTGSAVKQHVSDHIKDIIQLHCIVQNKVVGTLSRDGFFPVYPGDLYVHPVTGILCQVKATRAPYKRVSKRRKTKHPVVKHPTDATIQYRLIDDIWYTIKLAAAPALVPVVNRVRGHGTRIYYTDTRYREYEKVLDVVFPLGTYDFERKLEYGSAALHAVKKSQCGRKELKYIREYQTP